MNKSIILKTLAALSFTIVLIFICSSYLFSKIDNKLIEEIKTYNLNSAIKALDERQAERLELNKKQMKETANMISKNSSLFLFNFDKDRLEDSLFYDIKKKGIKGVKVWDNTINEIFLVAFEKNGKIVFDTKVPVELETYPNIKRPINMINEEMVERIGYITLYYDESLIIKQINELKEKTKNNIEKFDDEIALQRQKSENIKNLVAFVFLVMILILMYVLLMYTVNKPLKIVKSGLDEFFLFLQNKKDSVQKIDLDTSDEFGQMVNSLNENILVCAKLHEEIYELNSNLEKRIEEKTKKVTTLLNNADQGFLTFSSDFIIDEEYSKQCINIFKKEIAGLDISQLLFKDENRKEFFINTLVSLLKETNSVKIKNIISLLQSEFIINKKAIHVKYKIIDKNKYMLILTDITAKKLLEKKINKEKNRLKMIVSIVSDVDEFFELYDEFMDFTKNKSSLIDEKKTALHNTNELYRVIHTYKGLFSQKEMSNTVLKLHKLESSLSSMIKNQNCKNDDIKELLLNSDFEEWIKKDIDVIKDILGDELFSKRGKVVVKEESLSQIENKIINISNKYDNNNEYKEVVNDIKNLRNKTVYSLFSSYPKLVDQLSQKLEKSIYPLEIIVDKELRVSDRIKPFIKSLIHVFRNSVDHGIETLEDRYILDKDEVGTISCTIKEKNNNLHIIIADDGAGLDVEKIKEKARSLNIDISKLNDEEIKFLIFSDQFSTKEEVSQVSGRGVGMAVVKSELDKLAGSINIHTQTNIGTTFEFIVPLKN